MKANKIIAKILIMTMVFSIITSSLAYGEGQINKEETVYVNLDNNGKAIEKISSIWLYSDSPLKNVEDKSILKDVVNVKGKEKAEIKDGKLIWNTDNTEIYYRGNVEKQLPLNPKIKYFLDGKEVQVEDILGESGRLKIQINIENTDKHSINKNGKTQEA